MCIFWAGSAGRKIGRKKKKVMEPRRGVREGENGLLKAKARGPTKGVQPRKPTDNNNGAFPRGGPERGNPAMRAKRLRQGVKETHNTNVVGENVPE